MHHFTCWTLFISRINRAWLYKGLNDSHQQPNSDLAQFGEQETDDLEVVIYVRSVRNVRNTSMLALDVNMFRGNVSTEMIAFSLSCFPIKSCTFIARCKSLREKGKTSWGPIVLILISTVIFKYILNMVLLFLQQQVTVIVVESLCQ